MVRSIFLNIDFIVRIEQAFTIVSKFNALVYCKRVVRDFQGDFDIIRVEKQKIYMMIKK